MAVLDGRDALLAAAVIDGVCAGAHVETPLGERRIETLREGDPVLLAGGGVGIITWIGWVAVAADDRRNSPVVLPGGVMGQRMPRRALRVAPHQAVLCGGAGLIAAGLLFAPDPAAEPVGYFQISLRHGACLLVEGLALRSADAPADVVADPDDQRPAVIADATSLLAALAMPDDTAGAAQRVAALLEAIARLRRTG